MNFFFKYLLIGFFFIFPLVISNEYYLSVLTLAGLRSIALVGLCVLVSRTALVSLGHGAFVAIGAYGVTILQIRFGFSFIDAFCLAFVIGALASVFIGLSTLKLSGYYFTMITLGFGEIMQHLLRGSDFLGGSEGIGDIPKVSLFSFKLINPVIIFYFTWILVLGIVWSYERFLKSRYGRNLIVIGENKMLAQSLGINAYRYQVVFFVMACLLATVSGSLHAGFLGYVGPEDFDLKSSIFFIVCIVLGGMTSIYRGVLACAFFTILPELLRAFEDFELLFYSFFILLFFKISPYHLKKHLFDFKKKLLRKFHVTH